MRHGDKCHPAEFKVATSGLTKPREIPLKGLVPFSDPRRLRDPVGARGCSQAVQCSACPQARAWLLAGWLQGAGRLAGSRLGMGSLRPLPGCAALLAGCWLARSLARTLADSRCDAQFEVIVLVTRVLVIGLFDYRQ